MGNNSPIIYLSKRIYPTCTIQVHTTMSEMEGIVNTLQAIGVNPSLRVNMTGPATQGIMSRPLPYLLQNLFQGILNQRQSILILKFCHTQLQTHPHLLTLVPWTTPLILPLLVTLLCPSYHLKRRRTQGRGWIWQRNSLIEREVEGLGWRRIVLLGRN